MAASSSSNSKLYIFGAGGFAKEVYGLLCDINAAASDDASSLGFGGFVERMPERSTLNLGRLTLPLLSEDAFFEEARANRGTKVAIGTGNPQLNHKIARMLESRFGEGLLEFPNLIHPNFVGHQDSITWGKGNIVTAGCVFTVGIRVGSFNIFNLNSTLGHDSEIGSFNIFNPGCNLSGGSKIGDRNLFGTNSTILQNLSVGHDSVVGAGAVVHRPLADRGVYVGVPAKRLKDNPCP